MKPDRIRVVRRSRPVRPSRKRRAAMSPVMMQPQADVFPRSLPFELIPTNLTGVYTSPAPPDSLDPTTANAAGLARHGVLLRRPDANDHPGVAAFWKRVFSRKWSPADRIMPRLKPQYGKTHRLRGARKVSD